MKKECARYALEKGGLKAPIANVPDATVSAIYLKKIKNVTDRAMNSAAFAEVQARCKITGGADLLVLHAAVREKFNVRGARERDIFEQPSVRHVGEAEKP